MKKEILIVILILILSFPAYKALLQPGGFTSHDLTHHIVRQISMDKLLSEGQFPPRWSGDLNNGYGYPVFLFNYPLPALIGQVFHLLGFNFLYSVKAVLFSSMILSVLGMYLFLRSYLGSQMASFLGAMFYLYAPHRFLNVYVSGAVGSALGGAILPFVFWSMVEVCKRKSWLWVLGGSLLLALLVVAHNITTLISAPLILAFGLILIWTSKQKYQLLKKYLVMFFLGLGLSAWFWMPAFIEKQYIIFDQVFANFYQSQFITFWQLIQSPWGFGLSHPDNPEPGDLSYQIGIIHFLAITFLLFAVLIFKRIRRIGLFILFFFALYIFLILKISKPIWDFSHFMYVIQFPLRFSAVSVFTASIGVGLLIKFLPSKRLLFISFLILVIYANRNHWNINQVYDPVEDFYLSLKTTTASFDEHLPKWGRAMDKQPASKLEFVEGEGRVEIKEDKSALVLAQVEVTTSSKLKFNQFYFPGWEIEVNGQKVRFNYLEEGESHGLPIFEVPQGVHQVQAQFKNSLVRNIADMTSIISVILWVVLLCKLLILRSSWVKKSS